VNNRFAFKDLVQMMLLAGVIIAIFLAMKQSDRQWALLQSINNNLTEQTREMGHLRRAISNGVSLAGPTTRSAEAGGLGDPFKHVKEAQAKPDYAQGDWLVDTFQTRVPTLTPLVSQDLYSQVVNARVVEWLAYRDPYTLEYLPLLASSWQVSPDGLSITFQLRKGVVFSDGEPMTADDVVYSFKLPMDEKIAAPRFRAYLENIQDAVKTGPYEVVFKFKRPYYESFDLASGLEIIPKHFYEKYKPEEFNQSTGLLMGTGPYRMKDPTSWKPGTDIELVRNEKYWGEPGPWDKIVWRNVEQESAALTMFTNGELDAFAATPEQYRKMLKDQALVSRTQHFEYVPVTAGYFYVGWNQKAQGKTPTRFADKRVRQALTMLIDRDRMIQELLYGYAKPANGPFIYTSTQRDPDTAPLPYDPARAKALLKEAGFEDRNGDGVLESPTGEPFKFKFSYGVKLKLSEQIALFVKDGLAKAGIVAEPDPVDWPIMMKKINSRDFDAINLGWSSSIETDLFQAFHSSQIKDNGDNYVSYENPELDKLIEQARLTVDEEKRMPLWRKANRIISEDQPYTFLFDKMALGFFDKRIKNIQTSRVGLNYLSRFPMPYPWYVPKAEQKWK
jgi:peptide/nickel transport system substrate-binding protein